MNMIEPGQIWRCKTCVQALYEVVDIEDGTVTFKAVGSDKIGVMRNYHWLRNYEMDDTDVSF